MTQNELDILSVDDRYWVASRCVRLNSSGAGFYLYCEHGNAVHGGELFNAGGGATTYSSAVRPVISVKLNSYNIIASGTGTGSTTAWTIKKK